MGRITILHPPLPPPHFDLILIVIFKLCFVIEDKGNILFLKCCYFFVASFFYSDGASLRRSVHRAAPDCCPCRASAVCTCAVCPPRAYALLCYLSQLQYPDLASSLWLPGFGFSHASMQLWRPDLAAGAKPRKIDK